MVEISSSKPTTGANFPFAASEVLLIQYFAIAFVVLAVGAAVVFAIVFGVTLLPVPIFSQISEAVRGNVFNTSNEKPTPGVTSEASTHIGSHSASENRN